MLSSLAPLTWVLIFSLFVNLTYLASPLYMMQVYDRVMHSQSVPTLLYLSLAMVLAFAVFAILDGARGLVLAGISDIVERRLAGVLLEQVTRPAERGIVQPQAAQIGRDLDTVRQFAAGAGVLAFADLPWAPIYLLVITALHWSLGVFACGAALVLLGLTVLAEQMARRPMARAGAVAARAYQFGDAIARNADCARSMGQGPGLAKRWGALRADMLAAQNQGSARAVIIGAATKFARMFFQSAILGYGAWLAIQHQISAGAIFAGSLLLGRALAPVESITATWRSTVAARQAFSRIAASTRGGEERPAVNLPAARGELVLEQVGWMPAGAAHPVLCDVSVRIQAGAVLGIVGASAAGKSSLARILAGVVRPDGGAIRLDGAEYASWNAAQLGAAVGYLPQEVALFPGTIRENIARFGDATDEAVIAAAQAARAHDMIVGLPHGYQTRLDDDGRALSGGQKQRVALARALLGNPALVVLDEPNANLDSEGEAALVATIAALKSARRTVVLVTHRTSLLRAADFVASMNGGRMVEVRRAGEFLALAAPAPVLQAASA